jgi:hypothetical protein
MGGNRGGSGPDYSQIGKGARRSDAVESGSCRTTQIGPKGGNKVAGYGPVTATAKGGNRSRRVRRRMQPDRPKGPDRADGGARPERLRPGAPASA